MKKTLLASIVIFVAAIFAIRLTAPIFLKGIAERKLTKLFNMETHIRQVDVNPLRGKLTLIGVMLRHVEEMEEATSIKAEQVEIEPDFIALLRDKIIIINNLAIYDLEISTHRYRNKKIDILNTILEEVGGEVFIEGLDKIKLILKEANIPNARLQYIEHNVPFLKGRFERDRYIYCFSSMDIIYNDGALAISGLLEDGSLGAFEIKGKFALSQGQLKFSGSSKVSDLYIPYFWIYYYNHFKAGVQGGKLNMSSQFFIENGAIDVRASVWITQLDLVLKDEDNLLILGLFSEEDINYLRDAKGMADFKFRVRGMLNDPAISLKDEFRDTILLTLMNSLTNKIRAVRKVSDVIIKKIARMNWYNF